MKLERFNYNGTEITFQLGNGDTMVNATEMAKSFGKRPAKWLELPSTISFLETLKTVRKSDSLIKATEGRNGGTWMHEDVAIEFARWLAPEFAIWCNDRIKELMQHGFTASDDKLEEMIANPDLVISLATQLKEERAEKKRLSEENERNKPLVDFANTVADTSDCVDMNEFAKMAFPETGMGRNKLFKYLRTQKILDKNNIPYQRYIDAGWFKTIEQPFNTPYGTKINLKTIITGKGQISIVEKIKKLQHKWTM